jgi:hypothetical protein
MATITVDQLVAELGYEIDTKDLARFKEGTDSAGVSTVAMGSLVAKAGEKIAAMGVQAAKAALVFTKELVTGFVEAGDQIGKTARQIGVSTDDLQGLTFAAKRSGVQVKSMEKGLKLLQVGMFDASTKGVGPFQEGIDALGISITSLEGLTTTEQLAVFADELNKVGSEAERTGIASKLFGARAGPELKTLLEGGSAGILELQERARELGGIIPEEGIANAEKLADTFTDLDTQMMGMKNTIGGALAPVVDEMVGELIEWIDNNRDFIDQDLPIIIRDAADAARELLPKMVAAAKSVSDMVGAVVQLEEKTGILGRTVDFLQAPFNAVNFILKKTRDLGFEIVDFILTLTQKIPLFADSAKELQNTLRIFRDSDTKVELSAETKKEIAVTEKRFKEQAEKDKAGEKTIGGLAESEARSFRGGARLAPARSRVRVLAEKIENKSKLSRAEKKEARALGLDVPRGKGGRGGGRGGKKKDATILDMLGIKDPGSGLGTATAPSGGGASPLAGANFTTIDQSLNVRIEGITVQGDPTTAAGVVAGAEDALRKSPIWREIFDHYHDTLPGVG